MKSSVQVYLLGGPYHGDIECIDSTNAVMKEVTAKTHGGLITFMCYYRSTGMFDEDNNLIFKYDEGTAQFIRFKNARFIDEIDRQMLHDIQDHFASRRVSLSAKVAALKQKDPKLLKAILDGDVGACKIQLGPKDTIYSKSANGMYLHITTEDAKNIKNARQ